MPGLILDGVSFGQIEVHGKNDDVATYNATLAIIPGSRYHAWAGAL